MRCKHCWVDASKPMVPEVPVEDFIRAVEEGTRLGLMYVKITGGEPFIRKDDVFKLIEACKQHQLKVIVETNGTLIDEEDVVLLKKLGITNMAISLDYSDEELFDEFRGLKGAFQKAIKTMKLCVKYEIHCECIMSVIKGNLNDIANVSKLVLEDIGVKALKISPCIAMGRARELGSELLCGEDLFKFRELLYKLADKYPRRIFSFLPWVLSRIKYLKTTRGSCGFKSLLTIMPNGDVTLCGLNLTHPEVVFGNITHNTIGEIWNSQHPLLIELSSLSPDGVSGVCSRCIFRKYCFNPCPAHTYEAYATFKASYPVCQELYEKGLFPRDFLII